MTDETPGPREQLRQQAEALTAGENTLARYRGDARAVAEADYEDLDELETDIAELLQRYIAHDMEWAALAIEGLLGEATGAEVGAAIQRVAASIRTRGRPA